MKQFILKEKLEQRQANNERIAPSSYYLLPRPVFLYKTKASQNLHKTSFIKLPAHNRRESTKSQSSNVPNTPLQGDIEVLITSSTPQEQKNKLVVRRRSCYCNCCGGRSKLEAKHQDLLDELETIGREEKAKLALQTSFINKNYTRSKNSPFRYLSQKSEIFTNSPVQKRLENYKKMLAFIQPMQRNPKQKNKKEPTPKNYYFQRVLTTLTNTQENERFDPSGTEETKREFEERRYRHMNSYESSEVIKTSSSCKEDEREYRRKNSKTDSIISERKLVRQPSLVVSLRKDSKDSIESLRKKEIRGGGDREVAKRLSFSLIQLEESRLKTDRSIVFEDTRKRCVSWKIQTERKESPESGEKRLLKKKPEFVLSKEFFRGMSAKSKSLPQINENSTNQRQGSLQKIQGAVQKILVKSSSEKKILDAYANHNKASQVMIKKLSSKGRSPVQLQSQTNQQPRSSSVEVKITDRSAFMESSVYKIYKSKLPFPSAQKENPVKQEIQPVVLMGKLKNSQELRHHPSIALAHALVTSSFAEFSTEMGNSKSSQ